MTTEICRVVLGLGEETIVIMRIPPPRLWGKGGGEVKSRDQASHVLAIRLD